MRVREFGAAYYGFIMVANGSIDGYCILQNTPWNIEPGLLACIESGAKVYRDNFCTIVANSNDIIDLIKNSIQIAFKDGLKYQKNYILQPTPTKNRNLKNFVTC